MDVSGATVHKHARLLEVFRSRLHASTHRHPLYFAVLSSLTEEYFAHAGKSK